MQSHSEILADFRHNSKNYTHVIFTHYHREPQRTWILCLLPSKWPLGLPRRCSGKESSCQCRRHRRCRFNSWVGKSPWRREWQPTPVLLLGKTHGQRSLAGCSPWGRKRVRHDWVIKQQKQSYNLGGKKWSSQMNHQDENGRQKVRRRAMTTRDTETNRHGAGPRDLPRLVPPVGRLEPSSQREKRGLAPAVQG